MVEGKAVKPWPAKRTRDLAETARWDSSADDRLTVDVFMDLYMLNMQYNFDLGRAVNVLVQWARRVA